MGQRRDDSRVIGALMDALRDADPWVRYYSCQSLGKLEWNDAAPRIEELLRDPAGQVRVSAIEALSHLGGDRARRALLNAATSEDVDLARAALIGLGIAPHSDALPTLLSASTAADPTTRLMALSALSKFESPKVLEVLIRTLGDADPSVRNAAWGFLAARSGADATAALVEQLRIGKNVERAVAALASPTRGRVGDIVSNLRKAEESTARGLVSALARIGTDDAMTALVLAMTGETPIVRRIVAPVLGALGTRESIDALRRAETHDPDPEVRRICALLVPS
jgi:HEAT repeat protein